MGWGCGLVQEVPRRTWHSKLAPRLPCLLLGRARQSSGCCVLAATLEALAQRVLHVCPGRQNGLPACRSGHTGLSTLRLSPGPPPPLCRRAGGVAAEDHQQRAQPRHGARGAGVEPLHAQGGAAVGRAVAAGCSRRMPASGLVCSLRMLQHECVSPGTLPRGIIVGMKQCSSPAP